MSPRERNALILVLALGVGGHLLRAAGAGEVPRAAPEGVLLDPAGDGDPRAQRDLAEALSRPLAADERVDADRATVRELQRLPGVGPALAGRIVADRESRGAFGQIAALDRVAGIGPATLARLAPHLTFSGQPAEARTDDGAGAVSLNTADVAELDALPGIGPVKARAIVAFRDSAGPFRDARDLGRVPGFSRALVDRLLPRVRPP
jgi:competence ComEA-like helix-hairpin-helix protein